MTNKFNVSNIFPLLCVATHLHYDKKSAIRYTAELVFSLAYSSAALFLAQGLIPDNKRLQDYDFINQTKMTNSHLEKLIK